MKTIALLAVALLLQAQPGETPAPKTGGWAKRHEAFVEEAKKGGFDVLFTGDSITDGWRNNPQKKIFDATFGPLKPANFGISGDRTQHVLWRLDNGEVEGISPKVAVLMIGTNNLGSNTNEEIVSGVTKIVKTLHTKLPQTKVLLLGIFPRGEKPDDKNRPRIKAINEQLAKLDDGGMTVKYLDIGQKFLTDDGTLTKEVMPDALHPNEKGYQIWAEAMDPTLKELMK